ncbi:MAG: hypothetical protein BJG00_001110 [Limnothrix sp. CACIAM 69d]|nr:MAG: hypothetical protein BJG00_001110 [Limnothrix sp. CACIAM 69d]
MLKRPILDPDRNYTFRSYFELPYETDEVLAEFGYELRTDRLALPHSAELPPRLPAIAQEIEEILRLTLLSSEAAKRELLIAPIIAEIARFCRCSLRIEYNLTVNQWLKGELDYLLRSHPTQTQTDRPDSILVIEAKRDDLTRGFTQLAVELIALAEVEPGNVFYGAVTTGNIWQFGQLDRPTQTITQDLQQRSIFSNLPEIASILVGILKPIDPHSSQSPAG